MMDNKFYIIIFILVAIVFVAATRKESLSLSQFPVPTCSTCNSCTFYNCGNCGTVYQEQNKVNQTCDCGGTTVYRTPVEQSCYRPTINREGFRVKGLCHTCREAAGTHDGGSTWLRNLPCPVPFPPVVDGMQPVAHKQLRHVSEANVRDHLEQGGLVAAAKSSAIISYALNRLTEQTAAAGNEGYPDFYDIEGPVVIMIKIGDVYFWMIDYPIKYNPGNFSKYVGYSRSWNVAKVAYQRGRSLLNLNAPVVFFSTTGVRGKLLQSAAKCMPQGAPQSNTDFYFVDSDGVGCARKSCLWGPEYGSGNWTTRV